MEIQKRKSGRYTAIVTDAAGKRRSIGTFDTDAEAREAALEAEDMIHMPGLKDPVARLTITVADYSKIFMDQHLVEPNTKVSYRSALNKHLLPALGKTKLREVTHPQFRRIVLAWSEAGLSPRVIKHNKSVMSALMQMAVEDGLIPMNPIRGVRTPRMTTQDIPVLSQSQFEAVSAKLPTEGAKLYAYTMVSTGVRLNELRALRPIDVQDSSILVRRVVNQLDGGGWQERESTKGFKHRTIAVHAELVRRLRDWTASNGIADGDPIFELNLVFPNRNRRRKHEKMSPEFVATLGTFVGKNGRTYGHGTVNGYVTGGCRCDHCRCAQAVYSREYQRMRRGNLPEKPTRENGPWISDAVWGKVWKRACRDAELPFFPDAYHLRHTHASWLMAAGETPKVVMERLGHSDLSITSRYVQVIDGTSAAYTMESLMEGLNV